MEWGRPIALAYLDLDNFKLVNDAIGHGAGDELLIAVADVIGSTIREADVLARLGGDEFAVLFPNTDTEGATRVVERMLAGIRERVFIIAGRPVRITASVGIALAPTHGREATDLLAHADMALYRAKVDRDSYRMYAPDKDSQQSLEHDRVVELQVRDALQEDRLMLFAQRVVPLDGQAPDQFEVLLRLMGEDGAIVPPNQFLPLAERSHLIVEIDRWVCRATIDFLVTYGSAAAPVVHVNLSGKAIGDAQLIVELKQLLATYAFDPSRIVFEITETAAVTNLGAASQFIQTLKGLGFRFALDDFGVGYSSISHLKNLDVDYLKLDGSFITNLTRDTRDQHLVRAIVELAKALDKETVAEYVGDQETVDALRSLGVDFGQGYFLGRPGPIREVIDGARSFEAPAPPRFEGAQSVVPATEH
jgi:diguanylate cyclase (GGDEF)-like protein